MSWLVYLGPMVVGSVVAKYPKWQDLPYYFASGTLIFFALALTVQYVGVAVWGWNFADVFFPVAHALIALGSGRLAWLWAKNRFRINWQVLGVVLGVGALSGLAYSIWTYRSPYTLNWDWFQHQTMSRLILGGDFSFFTSQISDTFGFNSYPPFLHLLVSIAQYPSRLTPEYVLTFWQYMGFWHLLTVGLVSWLLAWIVSHKVLMSWLAAGIAVLTFDPMMSFTSFFFLPQTVAAVMFVGMIPKVLYGVRAREMGVILASLTLMHYMVGVVAAIMSLALWVYQVIAKRSKAVAYSLAAIVLLLVGGIGIYLLNHQLSAIWINHGESEQYLYSWSEKILAIERTYGYLAYMMLPLGVGWILHKRRLSGVVILVFTIGLSLAVFAQVPYVWKLFTILRFLAGMIMAAGLYVLLTKISSNTLKGLAVIVIVMGLCLNLVMNSMYWKDGIANGDEFRHVSPDDIAAAQLLFDRYEGKRVLLLSDPSTQFVLEGMGGVDTIGGAYMPVAFRQKLISVLETRKPEQIIGLVQEMNDGVAGEIDERVVAISGRTFVWLEASKEDRLLFSYNVWAPQSLSQKQILYLNTLRDTAGFREIYSSPTLYLFVVEAT